MFKIKLETEINKPIKDVTRLFGDRKYLPQWQPGLVSSEKIQDHPPTYQLIFQVGRRKMKMKETILKNELPQLFEGTYDMRGVHNIVKNSFEATGPQSTRWTCETEFKFKGIMSLLATYMRSGFLKQSEIIMKNFKGFAESFGNH